MSRNNRFKSMLVCILLLSVISAEARDLVPDEDGLKPNSCCVLSGDYGCKAKCDRLCTTFFNCISWAPACRGVFCDCHERIPTKRMGISPNGGSTYELPPDVPFMELLTKKFMRTPVFRDLEKVLPTVAELVEEVRQFLYVTDLAGYDLKKELKQRYPPLKYLFRRLRPRPLSQIEHATSAEVEKEGVEIEEQPHYFSSWFSRNQPSQKKFEVDTPENEKRIIDLIKGIKNKQDLLDTFIILNDSTQKPLYKRICRHFLREGLRLPDGTEIIKPVQNHHSIGQKVEDGEIMNEIQNKIIESNDKKKKHDSSESSSEERTRKKRKHKNQPSTTNDGWWTPSLWGSGTDTETPNQGQIDPLKSDTGSPQHPPEPLEHDSSWSWLSWGSSGNPQQPISDINGPQELPSSLPAPSNMSSDQTSAPSNYDSRSLPTQNGTPENSLPNKEKPKRMKRKKLKKIKQMKPLQEDLFTGSKSSDNMPAAQKNISEKDLVQKPSPRRIRQRKIKMKETPDLWKPDVSPNMTSKKRKKAKPSKSTKDEENGSDESKIEEIIPSQTSSKRPKKSKRRKKISPINVPESSEESSNESKELQKPPKKRKQRHRQKVETDSPSNYMGPTTPVLGAGGLLMLQNANGLPISPTDALLSNPAANEISPQINNPTFESQMSKPRNGSLSPMFQPNANYDASSSTPHPTTGDESEEDSSSEEQDGYLGTPTSDKTSIPSVLPSESIPNSMSNSIDGFVPNSSSSSNIPALHDSSTSSQPPWMMPTNLINQDNSSQDDSSKPSPYSWMPLGNDKFASNPISSSFVFPNTEDMGSTFYPTDQFAPNASPIISDSQILNLPSTPTQWNGLTNPFSSPQFGNLPSVFGSPRNINDTSMNSDDTKVIPSEQNQTDEPLLRTLGQGTIPSNFISSNGLSPDSSTLPNDSSSKEIPEMAVKSPFGRLANLFNQNKPSIKASTLSQNSNEPESYEDGFGTPALLNNNPSLLSNSDSPLKSTPQSNQNYLTNSDSTMIPLFEENTANISLLEKPNQQPSKVSIVPPMSGRDSFTLPSSMMKDGRDLPADNQKSVPHFFGDSISNPQLLALPIGGDISSPLSNEDSHTVPHSMLKNGRDLPGDIQESTKHPQNSVPSISPIASTSGLEDESSGDNNSISSPFSWNSIFYPQNPPKNYELPYTNEEKSINDLTNYNMPLIPVDENGLPINPSQIPNNSTPTSANNYDPRNTSSDESLPDQYDSPISQLGDKMDFKKYNMPPIPVDENGLPIKPNQLQNDFAPNNYDPKNTSSDESLPDHYDSPISQLGDKIDLKKYNMPPIPVDENGLPIKPNQLQYDFAPKNYDPKNKSSDESLPDHNDSPINQLGDKMDVNNYNMPLIPVDENGLPITPNQLQNYFTPNNYDPRNTSSDESLPDQYDSPISQLGDKIDLKKYNMPPIPVDENGLPIKPKQLQYDFAPKNYDPKNKSSDESLPDHNDSPINQLGDKMDVNNNNMPLIPVDENGLPITPNQLQNYFTPNNYDPRNTSSDESLPDHYDSPISQLGDKIDFKKYNMPPIQVDENGLPLKPNQFQNDFAPNNYNPRITSSDESLPDHYDSPISQLGDKMDFKKYNMPPIPVDENGLLIKPNQLQNDFAPNNYDPRNTSSDESLSDHYDSPISQLGNKMDLKKYNMPSIPVDENGLPIKPNQLQYDFAPKNYDPKNTSSDESLPDHYDSPISQLGYKMDLKKYNMPPIPVDENGLPIKPKQLQYDFAPKNYDPKNKSSDESLPDHNDSPINQLGDKMDVNNNNMPLIPVDENGLPLKPNQFQNDFAPNNYDPRITSSDESLPDHYDSPISQLGYKMDLKKYNMPSIPVDENGLPIKPNQLQYDFAPKNYDPKNTSSDESLPDHNDSPINQLGDKMDVNNNNMPLIPVDENGLPIKPNQLQNYFAPNNYNPRITSSDESLPDHYDSPISQLGDKMDFKKYNMPPIPVDENGLLIKPNQLQNDFAPNNYDPRNTSSDESLSDHYDSPISQLGNKMDLKKYNMPSIPVDENGLPIKPNQLQYDFAPKNYDPKNTSSDESLPDHYDSPISQLGDKMDGSNFNMPTTLVEKYGLPVKPNQIQDNLMPTGTKNYDPRNTSSDKSLPDHNDSPINQLGDKMDVNNYNMPLIPVDENGLPIKPNQLQNYFTPNNYDPRNTSSDESLSDHYDSPISQLGDKIDFKKYNMPPIQVDENGLPLKPNQLQYDFAPKNYDPKNKSSDESLPDHNDSPINQLGDKMDVNNYNMPLIPVDENGLPIKPNQLQNYFTPNNYDPRNTSSDESLSDHYDSPISQLGDKIDFKKYNMPPIQVDENGLPLKLNQFQNDFAPNNYDPRITSSDESLPDHYDSPISQLGDKMDFKKYNMPPIPVDENGLPIKPNQLQNDFAPKNYDPKNTSSDESLPDHYDSPISQLGDKMDGSNFNMPTTLVEKYGLPVKPNQIQDNLMPTGTKNYDPRITSSDESLPGGYDSPINQLGDEIEKSNFNASPILVDQSGLPVKPNQLLNDSTSLPLKSYDPKNTSIDESLLEQPTDSSPLSPNDPVAVVKTLNGVSPSDIPSSEMPLIVPSDDGRLIIPKTTQSEISTPSIILNIPPDLLPDDMRLNDGNNNLASTSSPTLSSDNQSTSSKGDMNNPMVPIPVLGDTLSSTNPTQREISSDYPPISPSEARAVPLQIIGNSPSLQSSPLKSITQSIDVDKTDDNLPSFTMPSTIQQGSVDTSLPLSDINGNLPKENNKDNISPINSSSDLASPNGTKNLESYPSGINSTNNDLSSPLSTAARIPNDDPNHVFNESLSAEDQTSEDPSTTTDGTTPFVQPKVRSSSSPRPTSSSEENDFIMPPLSDSSDSALDSMLPQITDSNNFEISPKTTTLPSDLPLPTNLTPQKASSARKDSPEKSNPMNGNSLQLPDTINSSSVILDSVESNELPSVEGPTDAMLINSPIDSKSGTRSIDDALKLPIADDSFKDSSNSPNGPSYPSGAGTNASPSNSNQLQSSPSISLPKDETSISSNSKNLPLVNSGNVPLSSTEANNLTTAISEKIPTDSENSPQSLTNDPVGKGGDIAPNSPSLHPEKNMMNSLSSSTVGNPSNTPSSELIDTSPNSVVPSLSSPAPKNIEITPLKFPNSPSKQPSMANLPSDSTNDFLMKPNPVPKNDFKSQNFPNSITPTQLDSTSSQLPKSSNLPDFIKPIDNKSLKPPPTFASLLKNLDNSDEDYALDDDDDDYEDDEDDFDDSAEFLNKRPQTPFTSFGNLSNNPLRTQQPLSSNPSTNGDSSLDSGSPKIPLNAVSKPSLDSLDTTGDAIPTSSSKLSSKSPSNMVPPLPIQVPISSSPSLQIPKSDSPKFSNSTPNKSLQESGTDNLSPPPDTTPNFGNLKDSDDQPASSVLPQDGPKNIFDSNTTSKPNSYDFEPSNPNLLKNLDNAASLPPLKESNKLPILPTNTPKIPSSTSANPVEITPTSAFPPQSQTSPRSIDDRPSPISQSEHIVSSPLLPSTSSMPTATSDGTSPESKNSVPPSSNPLHDIPISSTSSVSTKSLSSPSNDFVPQILNSESTFPADKFESSPPTISASVPKTSNTPPTGNPSSLGNMSSTSPKPLNSQLNSSSNTPNSSPIKDSSPQPSTPVLNLDSESSLPINETNDLTPTIPTPIRNASNIPPSSDQASLEDIPASPALLSPQPDSPSDLSGMTNSINPSPTLNSPKSQQPVPPPPLFSPLNSPLNSQPPSVSSSVPTKSPNSPPALPLQMTNSPVKTSNLQMSEESPKTTSSDESTNPIPPLLNSSFDSPPSPEILKSPDSYPTSVSPTMKPPLLEDAVDQTASPLSTPLSESTKPPNLSVMPAASVPKPQIQTPNPIPSEELSNKGTQSTSPSLNSPLNLSSSVPPKSPNLQSTSTPPTLKPPVSPPKLLTSEEVPETALSDEITDDTVPSPTNSQSPTSSLGPNSLSSSAPPSPKLPPKSPKLFTSEEVPETISSDEDTDGELHSAYNPPAKSPLSSTSTNPASNSPTSSVPIKSPNSPTPSTSLTPKPPVNPPKLFTSEEVPETALSDEITDDTVPSPTNWQTPTSSLGPDPLSSPAPPSPRLPSKPPKLFTSEEVPETISSDEDTDSEPHEANPSLEQPLISTEPSNSSPTSTSPAPKPPIKPPILFTSEELPETVRSSEDADDETDISDSPPKPPSIPPLPIFMKPQPPVAISKPNSFSTPNIASNPINNFNKPSPWNVPKSIIPQSQPNVVPNDNANKPRNGMLNWRQRLLQKKPLQPNLMEIQ